MRSWPSRPTHPAFTLCRAAAQLPEGRAWVYEPKWDGFRALVARHGSDVSITGRNGGRLARFLPEVAQTATHSLPDGSVVDGEITATTAHGLAFDALLQRLARGRPEGSGDAQIAFVAFDILLLDGQDLCGLPLKVRRRAVERLVDAPGMSTTPQTDDIDAARRWLEEFTSLGFEGVVAKRTTQPTGPANASG